MAELRPVAGFEKNFVFLVLCCMAYFEEKGHFYAFFKKMKDFCTEGNILTKMDYYRQPGMLPRRTNFAAPGIKGLVEHVLFDDLACGSPRYFNSSGKSISFGLRISSKSRCFWSIVSVKESFLEEKTTNVGQFSKQLGLCCGYGCGPDHKWKAYVMAGFIHSDPENLLYFKRFDAFLTGYLGFRYGRDKLIGGGTNLEYFLTPHPRTSFFTTLVRKLAGKD